MTYSLSGKTISSTYQYLIQTRNGLYYDGLGNQIILSASGSVGATGAGGSLGYFGSFYDTTTQTNPTASFANVIKLNSTLSSNGVNNDGGTKVIFENSGTYLLTLSAQFNTPSNSSQDADMWLRLNGVDQAYTNNTITLAKVGGSGNSYGLIDFSHIVTVSANDYIQFVWQSTDTTMSIFAQGTQSTPNRPQTPSVSLQVSQIMYTQIGPTGSVGATGASYNFSTGLTVSGLTVSVDTSIIATTATLSNYVTSATLAGYNYVTASIVNGYLTQSALSNYATTATLSNYVTSATLAGYNYVTASIVNGYLTQSALSTYATTATLSNYVTSTTLAGYNYVTASVVNGYLTQSALSTYATTATLSNYLKQGGNSFGTTFSIGSTDNNNVALLINNNTFVTAVTGSNVNSTSVSKPSATFVINSTYNIPATSGVLTASTIISTNSVAGAALYIQGNSVLADTNSAIISTMHMASGTGLMKPHIRFWTPSGSGAWIGQQDNSAQFGVGLGNSEYYRITSSNHQWNTTVQSSAQSVYQLNAPTGNNSGVSVGLLVNHSGSNSASGGGSSLRVNNTITAAGTGTQSSFELMRNSVTVWRKDLVGKDYFLTGSASSLIGTVSLVAGKATVNTTSVTGSTIVMLTPQTIMLGNPCLSGRTNGASFSIQSTNLTDTGVVGWYLIN